MKLFVVEPYTSNNNITIKYTTVFALEHKTHIMQWYTVVFSHMLELCFDSGWAYLKIYLYSKMTDVPHLTWQSIIIYCIMFSTNSEDNDAITIQHTQTYWILFRHWYVKRARASPTTETWLISCMSRNASCTKSRYQRFTVLLKKVW